MQVCVFTAPIFSALCALAAYLLVKEIRGQGAGLCAAAFMGLIPSYISRSVAGSFDLEGVAIFALVFTFYLYVKVGAASSAGPLVRGPCMLLLGPSRGSGGLAVQIDTDGSWDVIYTAARLRLG